MKIADLFCPFFPLIINENNYWLTPFKKRKAKAFDGAKK